MMERVEHVRPRFRALILSNANYFGNLKDSELKPVLNIQADTTYEELGCVGFQPQLNRLEGIVYINQQSGYGGGICSAGTQEYVRFYLSSDNGATWQDQGVVGFTAYDVASNERLEYAVTLQIDPAKTFCFVENLPLVRAILSWNFSPPPNTPNFNPVWGNVVEERIQIAPRPFYLLADVLKEAKVELPQKLKSVLDLTQTVSAAKPKALGAAELHSLYKDTKVPGHRFMFAEVQKFIANPALAKDFVKAGSKASASAIDIDIEKIIGQLLETDGDTGFEQLHCIGLDPNRDALEGVLTLKLASGYSGGPCTAGSQEYVAFWVDWGDGAGWTYAGTASVNVHDLSGIPPKGLEYAVYLPVDVASHRQPCQKGPKTAQVRAILSWEAPPPPGDPNYKPVWGNRLETRILVNPGNPFVVGTPNISILGGIGIADINVFGDGMTTPTGKFALTGGDADGWSLGRECPFGGLVTVQGAPSVGYKYRVWVRDTGGGLPMMVTTPIRTVDFNGVGTYRFPDGSGFFTYLDSLQNQDNLLAWWSTSGDDKWQIWLEIADMADNVLGSTLAYNIQLDNTSPTANPPLNPPTVDIHIDSGGDCKDFGATTKVTGHFVALDVNFGAYYLYTLPFGTPPGVLTPTVGYVETALAPGDVWTLDTTGMQPCGYVVKLDVYDRAIVGSSPGSHHAGSASVGFCLRAG
jgi:hypothetical protein